MRAGMPSLDQTPDSSTHHAPTLPHARHHPRARAACAHPHDRSLYRPDVTALANCADCAPRSHPGGLRCPRLRCWRRAPGGARSRGAQCAPGTPHPRRGGTWLRVDCVRNGGGPARAVQPGPAQHVAGGQWRGHSEPALRRDLAPDRGGRGPGALRGSLRCARSGSRWPRGDRMRRSLPGCTPPWPPCRCAANTESPHRPSVLAPAAHRRGRAPSSRVPPRHRAIGPSTRTQQKPTPHIARRTGFSFDCPVPRAPTPSIASTHPRSHVNRHVVRNPH